MENLPEGYLVERAKEGDMEAFGELVNRYQKRIYLAIYQMTNNHSEADDLSQETFLKAYQALSKFKKESSFYTWLYRIAVNLVFNFLKKERRLKKYPLDEKEIRKMGPHFSNSPQKIMEGNELQTKMKEIINTLPLNQRMAINLVIYQGMSHKQVAKIQRCSEGTVSWRLFQARRILKEKLEPYLRGSKNEM
ncbi:MAG: sigma-70 family RNA polymerase sigma factor [Candidatus Aminicenantia bacterium]